MTNQNLFNVVDRPKRGRKQSSMSVDPAEVQRVALFHEFIAKHGQSLFKTTTGTEAFDMQTAKNVAARVKAVAKRNEIALDCKAEPNGRNEDGSVNYSVRGWIPKPRKASSNAVTL